MLAFLRAILKRSPTGAGEETREQRAERIRETLLSELSHKSIEGKPVTHRRLESLMLAAHAGKKETIQRLREIGARPSARMGKRLWTMDQR